MKVDSVLQARWIIPVEPDSAILEDHALVVHEGKIIDLAPSSLINNKYIPYSHEKLERHALIPGFINTHTHASMSLMRGIADDLPLMTWLNEHIWPLEEQWVNEAFVRDGTDLAIAEMILSGTTCFNDMYFFPEISAQRAIMHGMRASVGLIVIDFATVWAQNAEEYIEKGLTLHEKLRHESLITTPFAPHSPYTVSNEALTKIRVLADELEIPVHMHVHETATEVKQHKAQFGCSPLQRLTDLGLLSPSFIAVHMTQLNEQQIHSFAQSGAHIIHCPQSNLKLASGFCPVQQCLDAGINTALGTDGAASNNNLDIMAEMRIASLLAKGVAKNASAMPAATALRMATLNGAKALGLEDVTGSLSIGKYADIVAIDMQQINSQPTYDPISQIVYACNRNQVSDVWVSGKQLLKQRQLTTLDEQELMQKACLWQAKLSGKQ